MQAIAKRMKHKGDLASFAARMRTDGEKAAEKAGESPPQTVARYQKLLARIDAADQARDHHHRDHHAGAARRQARPSRRRGAQGRPLTGVQYRW